MFSSLCFIMLPLFGLLDHYLSISVRFFLGANTTVYIENSYHDLLFFEHGVANLSLF